MHQILLAATLLNTPLAIEEMSTHDQRLFILSAAAGFLCLVKDAPLDQASSALAEFMGSISNDFPDQDPWLRQRDTFRAAAGLSLMLNTNCKAGTKENKDRMYRHAEPFLF